MEMEFGLEESDAAALEPLARGRARRRLKNGGLTLKGVLIEFEPRQCLQCLLPHLSEFRSEPFLLLSFLFSFPFFLLRLWYLDYER